MFKLHITCFDSMALVIAPIGKITIRFEKL